MKIILAFVLYILTSLLWAQTTGEMRAQLSTEEDDSTRVALLGSIAIKYARSNPDSAYYFGRMGFAEATATKDQNGLSLMNNVLGNINFGQSNYDSCIFYWTACYEIAVNSQDSLRIAAMLNNLGLVYTYKTEYDTSIQILLRARAIRIALGDPKISSTVNNIGIAYQRMSDWDRALEYYLEAADLKEKAGQKLSLSNTLNNIGIVLKRQGKHSEAIPYYQRSLDIAIEFNDKTKQANAHNNLAALYHLNPDLIDLAEGHYLESIALKSEMGDKAGLCNSYANIASIYAEQGKQSKALMHIEMAEALNAEVGLNLYTSNLARIKAQVLRDLGKYEEAYESMDAAYLMNTEEMNEDRNEKIAEWETRFEFMQNDIEIERLELSNELKEANLSRSKNAQWAIASTGVLGLLSLSIFFLMRQKKMNIERESQELRIEAMKKRLADLNALSEDFNLDLADLNEKIHNSLTEREFEVLTQSMNGKSNSEIAEALFVSVSTVKFHLRNTYNKLGVSNRKEAIQYVEKTS